MKIPKTLDVIIRLSTHISRDFGCQIFGIISDSEILRFIFVDSYDRKRKAEGQNGTNSTAYTYKTRIFRIFKTKI